MNRHFSPLILLEDRYQETLFYLILNEPSWKLRQPSPGECHLQQHLSITHLVLYAYLLLADMPLIIQQHPGLSGAVPPTYDTVVSQ
ncbi:hypothetical protein D3C77_600990 [compost metagenome]